MRKVKKVSLTILLALVVLLSNISIVNAAYSATFNLTTQNVNVKVGDEVAVTFSIGSINGFSDVGKVTTLKSYDSTIFEYLGAEGLNGWEVKEDATNIVLVRNQYAQSGDIAKLKFKVLKEVENTRIQLSEIDATGSDGNVYYDDENVNAPYVEFKVTAKDPVKDPTEDPSKDPTEDPSKDPVKDPAEDPSKDPVKNPTEDPTKNPTNDNKGQNTGVKNDKTTATSGKIPQTGEPYMIVILIASAIIVVGILFTRYKIYENRMK